MSPRPKIIKPTVCITLLLALLVLVAINLLNDKFVAVIHNDSQATMTNVEVNGDGAWRQSVPDIPAGETVTVEVTQSFSESSLGIRFQSNGAKIAKSHDVYITYGGVGTTATFTIEIDLDVKIAWRDGPAWIWR